MAEQRDSDPAVREGQLLAELSDVQGELEQAREALRLAARSTKDVTIEVLDDALGRERKATDAMREARDDARSERDDARAERDKWRGIALDLMARRDSLARDLGARIVEEGKIDVAEEKLDVESADAKTARLIAVGAAVLGVVSNVIQAIVNASLN